MIIAYLHVFQYHAALLSTDDKLPLGHCPLIPKSQTPNTICKRSYLLHTLMTSSDCTTYFIVKELMGLTTQNNYGN